MFGGRRVVGTIAMVRCYRVTEPVTQLMEAREAGPLSRMKAQLVKFDLLVLDELGYVPASKPGAE